MSPTYTFRNFISGYPLQKYTKGEIVVHQDEEPSSAYVIKHGVIKTYNLTDQGEEKPISFVVKDEVLPLAWVFDKSTVAPYYYEAFTDCSLHVVPREAYLDHIQSTSRNLYQYLDYVISRYLNLEMRVNALEQSKARDKIIHTLHFLSRRFGKDTRPDVVRIQLPLTQQDIANFMGVTRETASMELKRLESEGVISYRRQNYTVKTDRLNELLDEEYDPEALVTVK